MRDVCSLVSVMLIEEMGNPFKKESQALVILNSKDTAAPAACCGDRDECHADWPKAV